MNNIYYAIKILVNNEWTYITESCSDFQVKLYSCSETAENLAEFFRLTGKEDRVKVVTYKVED